MWGSSNMAIPMPWYIPLLSVAYDKYDAFAIGGVRGCCQTFLVGLMNLSIIYLSSELIVIYTQTVNRPGVL